MFMEIIQRNTHRRHGAPSLGTLQRVLLLAFGDGGNFVEQVTCQL